MSDRVLVSLPDGRWLALEDEAFRAALLEGSKLNAAPAPSGTCTYEPLLDAEQLASVLNVPSSWIEQKAREGVIPSLEFGRWRRFRRSDVEAAVSARRQD